LRQGTFPHPLPSAQFDSAANSRNCFYQFFTSRPSPLTIRLFGARYPRTIANSAFVPLHMTKLHYSTALPSYYFGVELGDLPRRPNATISRNAVAAILSPQDVLLGLDAPTKERALEEIARFIARRHGLREADVYSSLAEREKIGSTALGFGIAIPHARVPGLSQPVAAFVRTKSPVPFGAPDDKPVSDMLVLLVPAEVADEHLQLLAEVAEMFSDKRFRGSLRGRVEANAVYALLAGSARA